jgi:hypothetical protein
MWWKTQKESESPFRSMALGFLKDRRDVQFEGHCATCDAFQPVYFEALVEAHGKTAIFRDIESEIPCVFCQKAGEMSVRFIAD